MLAASARVMDSRHWHPMLRQPKVAAVPRIEIQKVDSARRATWHSNKRPAPIIDVDPRIVKTVLSERPLVRPATREAGE
jgi:hypothetical protein